MEKYSELFQNIIIKFLAISKSFYLVWRNCYDYFGQNRLYFFIYLLFLLVIDYLTSNKFRIDALKISNQKIKHLTTFSKCKIFLISIVGVGLFIDGPPYRPFYALLILYTLYILHKLWFIFNNRKVGNL
jgi:hypothetical protein